MLLIRTLWGILHVDPGFDAAHVLTFHIYPPNQTGTSGDSAAIDALFLDLLARLRSLPSVSSVSCASFVLFPDEMYKVPFEVEGRSAAPSTNNRFSRSPRQVRISFAPWEFRSCADERFPPRT